ncbi:MAG: hypothetical protein M3N98_06625, partial [Actinomycetota bacterium]|nr:hypothetical protein [Actinomycetota bacterium]
PLLVHFWGTGSVLPGICGAVIGAGVVLLPGVVIGPGALVGAGAVVVTDVAPGAVVAGNPARAIRSQRPEPGRQREVN